MEKDPNPSKLPQSTIGTIQANKPFVQKFLKTTTKSSSSVSRKHVFLLRIQKQGIRETSFYFFANSYNFFFYSTAHAKSSKPSTDMFLCHFKFPQIVSFPYSQLGLVCQVYVNFKKRIREDSMLQAKNFRNPYLCPTLNPLKICSHSQTCWGPGIILLLLPNRKDIPPCVVFPAQQLVEGDQTTI